MLRLNRRQLLAGGAALAALPLAAEWLPAQETNRESNASELITPAAQRAIDRGLDFLAKRQVTSGRGKGSFGFSGYSGGVAVCGLAGLAFMCSGSPPGQGPYGKHVDRCIEFLCANTGDKGYINNQGGHDSMYGHGFATLFLAEVYGMTQNEEVGEKLRLAVNLIVECQNDQGGWRYAPQKSDADLSITICQIMALRAARDAGIFVPDKTREKCIDYVVKSQNSDGGFRYQIGGGGSSFPLTGAGLVSLYSAGIYEGDQIDKALQWMMNQKPSSSGFNGSYYFYGQYYAAQAMWHAGGKYWAEWYPAIRDVLVQQQQSNGSWVDGTAGPEFGTAVGCIILQMPNDFLPIFAW